MHSQSIYVVQYILYEHTTYIIHIQVIVIIKKELQLNINGCSVEVVAFIAFRNLSDKQNYLKKSIYADGKNAVLACHNH